MLRACHNLLKPGGRLAFTTIYIVPGVSERDYRRTMRARGPGAAERRSMIDLLESAGFVSIRERDATKPFAKSTRAYIETTECHRRELALEWGAEKFRDSQRNRRATLAMIEAGVIRRGLFTARRPRRS